MMPAGCPVDAPLPSAGAASTQKRELSTMKGWASDLPLGRSDGPKRGQKSSASCNLATRRQRKDIVRLKCVECVGFPTIGDSDFPT